MYDKTQFDKYSLLIPPTLLHCVVLKSKPLSPLSCQSKLIIFQLRTIALHTPYTPCIFLTKLSHKMCFSATSVALIYWMMKFVITGTKLQILKSNSTIFAIKNLWVMKMKQVCCRKTYYKFLCDNYKHKQKRIQKEGREGIKLRPI